jgi:hypothetical protein
LAQHAHRLFVNRTRPSSEPRLATSSKPPPSETWKRPPSTRVRYTYNAYPRSHSFIPFCRVRPAQALHPNCLLHLLRHPLQGRSSSIWQARSCQLEEDPNSPSSTQVQGRKGVYPETATLSVSLILFPFRRGSTPPWPPLRMPRPLELKFRSLFNLKGKRNECDKGLNGLWQMSLGGTCRI